MGTKKLYDDHPYETEFEAKVLTITSSGEEKGWNVVLDQTLFFPEEGGQTPDRGSLVIGGVTYEVEDVSIQDGIITHQIRSEQAKEPEGETAKGRILWSHRYSNMQNHTGEHIFSGLVHAAKGYDNVGFHLSDHIVTMDYNGVLTEEEIQAFTAKANEVIAANLPVICAYPADEELAKMEYRSKKEVEGAVRIVTISGVDCCACCAPHVRTTAEVGLLMVVGSQNYKGGTRLSILCGQRAVEDYRKKHAMLSLVGRQLSTNWENIFQTVDKLKSERDNFKYRRAQLSAKLLEIEAKELSGERDVCLFTDCNDRNVLQRVVNKMKEEHSGISVIFSRKESDGEEEYTYVASSLTKDCRLFSEKLKKIFQAKGGGKSEMVQGSVVASKETLENCVKNLNIL
jgi:alanyl-tRNA synthetase